MINIILFGLTSLLADFSSEMVFPLLPFFIQSLGGAGLAVGLVFGLGDAVAAVFKVISGYWADKTRQYKLFIFSGYLFSAVAKFLYPFASSAGHVVAIRPIERIGKGFRDAPRDAVLSESIPENKRGLAFGIQRAMDSVGAIMGSVFVLVAYFSFGMDIRGLFIVSAVIALFAVVPILFVRTPERLKIKKESVSFRNLSPELRKFIFIAVVFALSHFSYAFFILKAQSSFSGLTERETISLAILFYIFLSVFDSLGAGFAGNLSDRIGRRRVVLLSYLLLSLVFLGFLMLSVVPSSNMVHFVFLLGLFVLYGLFRAFLDVSQKSFVSDLSSADMRGTALGTFETFTGLAAIPAGLIAGLLWNFDPAFAFIYGLGLSLVATFLLTQYNRPTVH